MNASTAAPLTRAEARAARIALGATIWFALYGYATHAPSTAGYLLSVAVIALGIRSLRREPLPALVAYGLATAAILHLAGGLVAIGDDGLYNASIGPYVGSLHTHLLQYDHFAHTFSSGIGTLTLWHLLVPPAVRSRTPRDAFALCALAGLGVGAVNETVEFLTTIAHHGAHVGGYTNTGWDLVANTLGVLAATAVIVRRSRVKLEPHPVHAR